MSPAENRLAKTALILALAVLAGIAVIGIYRVAGTALDRLMPPSAKNGAAVPVASRKPVPASSAASTVYEEKDSSDIPEKGVFSPFLEEARQKMRNMTLRQEVGQVFLFECPPEGAVKIIDDYFPGGYCLMERAFQGKTSAQVKKSLSAYQNSSRIPMLLACDEEGGTVVRISSNPKLAAKKFASPREVFAGGGLAAISSDTETKAKLLKALGVNVNLAPVCDISTSPSDFMYARSLGKDGTQTAAFVTASIKAYENQKVGFVLKHFPGYGGTKDTHTEEARDTRSYQSFEKSDFLPFEAGIRSGAACIMVSHNIVECMDAERPSSLSPQVHEILRKKLGFTGVIVTDSLSMGAILQYTGKQNAAVEAFLAGNDLLLTSDIKKSYESLYQAVEKGTVSRQRLEESVVRILAWKIQLGILR